MNTDKVKPFSPQTLFRFSPTIPSMALFPFCSRISSGNTVVFSCHVTSVYSRNSLFLFIFLAVLKNTDIIFCIITLSLDLSIVPRDQAQVMVFGRNSTEMMLCSSQCIMSGNTKCQPVPALVKLTLIPGHLVSVCQASSL